MLKNTDLNQKLIEYYHNLFKNSYIKEDNVNCVFDENLKFGAIACADFFDYHIIYNHKNEYKKEFIQLLVAHEFSHLILIKHLNNYNHDLTFSLVFNALYYRHFKKFEFRIYDIHQDKNLFVKHLTQKAIDLYQQKAIELTNINRIDLLCFSAQKFAEKVYQY